MSKDLLAQEIEKIAKHIEAAPRLYSLVQGFYRVQDHLGFGASDTEPRGTFADLMEKALGGRPWQAPSPEEWQLYRDKPGWRSVARKLTVEARRVAQEVQKASEADKRALAEYMGWRSQ